MVLLFRGINWLFGGSLNILDYVYFVRRNELFLFGYGFVVLFYNVFVKMIIFGFIRLFFL